MPCKCENNGPENRHAPLLKCSRMSVAQNDIDKCERKPARLTRRHMRAPAPSTILTRRIDTIVASNGSDDHFRRIHRALSSELFALSYRCFAEYFSQHTDGIGVAQ